MNFQPISVPLANVLAQMLIAPREIPVDTVTGHFKKFLFDPSVNEDDKDKHLLPLRANSHISIVKLAYEDQLVICEKFEYAGDVLQAHMPAALNLLFEESGVLSKIDIQLGPDPVVDVTPEEVQWHCVDVFSMGITVFYLSKLGRKVTKDPNLGTI